MSKRRTIRIRSAICALVLILIVCAASCKGGPGKSAEVAYVSAPQVNLRDRVAALYNKTGTLKNGEKVEVLEKSKRFYRVKSERGETGWVEARYLVDEDIYRQLQQLANEQAKTPVQAHGITRATLKMHVTPGRDTDSLIQLKEGDKIDILKRASTEKAESAAATKPAAKIIDKERKGKRTEPGEPEKPMEDWWLVRDADGHVGWVLSRMVDIDVPIDVAQYAEGQRIVAAFVLNAVHDSDAPLPTDSSAAATDSKSDDKRGARDVPQYLVLLTEPRDGMPWDYNQARIFTWNLKRHRYETAYRERNLVGVFPVTTGREDFGKEGVEPTFTLRVKDDNGSIREKKYRLIGPIVRRIMTPEEEAAEKQARADRKTAKRR